MSKKINLREKKNQKRKIKKDIREKREYKLFLKQKYETTVDYAINMFLEECE